MQKIGFDNELYIDLQSKKIKERINQFGGKLYLEFGGKLFDDYHAARVLPGFQPDGKIKMLSQLKNDVEIVVAINAQDIEKSKLRSDFGISYDVEVLRLIDAFREYGLYVDSVCITRFANQSNVIAYQKKLENLGIKVYRHYPIWGYPTNVSYIVSDEGYGKNEYIETTKPLVVVTAPGPGSGKMAICLSQIYHEFKKGIKAGYAKFETFPVRNLSLKHPVNLAYEAATVDLDDVNMIDPFHIDAYGTTAINYNRDVEIFPVLKTMFEQIMGESPYKSPTDMGVNMVGNAIVDEEAVIKASQQEILRRYCKSICEKKQGICDENQMRKLQLLLDQAGLSLYDRKTIQAAQSKSQTAGVPAVAIELADGQMVVGRMTNMLSSTSSAVLNALKILAGIPDDIKLISDKVLSPINDLKVDYLGKESPKLHLDEVLIALSICALTDENAKLALDRLPQLRGSEAHSTVIISQADNNVFRRLGINITCDPEYPNKKLYQI